LLVQRGAALSVGDVLTVAAAQPAVFTVNQQGTGQGVIVNARTGALADSSAPAAAGDTVIISATGLGAVDPPVPPGIAAPDEPSSQVVNEVSVTIGGLPAAVNSARLAPGSAGVYQVSVIVPDGVSAGGDLPVVITVAGQSSPAVTMGVK
jgi:uncharacterized protein (TIGR03437 family)